MSTWRPISPPRFWQRWLPERLHGTVRVLFQLFLVGLAVLLAGVFFYFLLARRYDLNEVARMPANNRYYDRRGKDIPTPASTGRKLVKRDDLPDFLVQALQAREDAHFYTHHGVDLLGLGRATLRNLIKSFYQ